MCSYCATFDLTFWHYACLMENDKAALLAELSSGIGIYSCSLGRIKILSNSMSNSSNVLCLQNCTPRLFRSKESEWQQVLAPSPRSQRATHVEVPGTLCVTGTCVPEVPGCALTPPVCLCRDEVLETQVLVTAASITSLG